MLEALAGVPQSYFLEGANSLLGELRLPRGVWWKGTGTVVAVLGLISVQVALRVWALLWKPCS